MNIGAGEFILLFFKKHFDFSYLVSSKVSLYSFCKTHMVDPNVLKGLTQASTVLSMIGAGLVAFTWAYPVENRNKHGRILLLWLSIADFFGSLFYFLQTFVNDDDSVFCKAYAALDIFFPVASFIWTDFIAYYLFLVVRQRSDASRYNWSRLLFSFHVIAWSVSLATMLLVLLFDHAGRDTGENTDDDGGAETAGWCWIQAHNAQERWLWELIGGKFIEWTSGLIIVPYLYISVAYQLYQIDRPQEDASIDGTRNFADRLFRGGKGRQLQTPLLHPSKFPSRGTPSSNAAPSECNTDYNGTIYSDSNEVTGVPATDLRVVNAGRNVNVTNNDNDASKQDIEDSLSRSEAYTVGEDLSYSRASSQYGAYIDENDMEFSYGDTGQSQRDGQSRGAAATAAAATRGTANPQARAYFSRFYLKLFVLPIVFIFIRLWSSLRVILLAAGANKASRNDFLLVTQAFFDPSQGFFNAVLFVFFSPEDRTRLWETLSRTTRHACIRCLGRERVETIIAKMPRFPLPSALSSASLATLDPTNNNDNNNDNDPNGRFKSSSNKSSDKTETSTGPYRSKTFSQDAIAMAPRPPSPRKPSQSAPQPPPHLQKLDKQQQKQQQNQQQEQQQHPLGERRLTNSSEVIEIEDDFECGDNDRFSDYSFDGRFDSNDDSTAASMASFNQQLSSNSPIQASQLLPPHIQALQQLHQLQTLQAYSASRSASRSISQNLHAGSPSPPPLALGTSRTVDSENNNNNPPSSGVNNPLHSPP